MQTDTETDKIVLNPDGSINTAYYTARGRHMRGEQAHHLGRGLFRAVAAFVLLPIRAAQGLTKRQLHRA